MTVLVQIYKTIKVSTQSGKGKQGMWCVEFGFSEGKKQDPITGWYGSGDTMANRKLYFETQDQAVKFCEENDFSYRVQPFYDKKITPKSYADNFLRFR